MCTAAKTTQYCLPYIFGKRDCLYEYKLYPPSVAISVFKLVIHPTNEQIACSKILVELNRDIYSLRTIKEMKNAQTLS